MEHSDVAHLTLEARLARFRAYIEDSLHFHDEYWERPEDRPEEATAIADAMFSVLEMLDLYVPEAKAEPAPA